MLDVKSNAADDPTKTGAAAELEISKSEEIDQPEVAEEEPLRKVPKWAIMLAVLAFVIFNSFFILFVVQSTNNGGGN